MQIEFDKTVTCSEFVETAQINMRRFSIGAYCFFAICAVLFYFLGNYNSALSAGLALIFVAILWEVIVPFIELPRKYRKAGLDGQSYSVLIDDEGMFVFGPDSQSRTSWAAFRRYRESRDLILLYTNLGSCVITPKRCLSALQLEEFEKFLKERFPS
jgi:hypothetical protein